MAPLSPNSLTFAPEAAPEGVPIPPGVPTPAGVSVGTPAGVPTPAVPTPAGVPTPAAVPTEGLPTEGVPIEGAAMGVAGDDGVARTEEEQLFYDKLLEVTAETGWLPHGHYTLPNRETMENAALYAGCPIGKNVFAVGGGDDSVRILEFRPGTAEMVELQRIAGVHKDTVSRVAMSCNGNFIATGGMDGVVAVHRILRNPNDPNNVLGVEPVPTSLCDYATEEIEAIAWAPKGDALLICSRDGSAYMWHAVSGYVSLFSGHGGAVTCGGFTSVKGTILAVTSSEDTSVQVWEPGTGRSLCKIVVSEENPIISMDISGEVAVVGCIDGTVVLVHLVRGCVIADAPIGRGYPIQTVAFAPEALSRALFGDILIAAGDSSPGGRIQVFNASSMALRGAYYHKPQALIEKDGEKDGETTIENPIEMPLTMSNTPYDPLNPFKKMESGPQRMDITTSHVKISEINDTISVAVTNLRWVESKRDQQLKLISAANCGPLKIWDPRHPTTGQAAVVDLYGGEYEGVEAVSVYNALDGTEEGFRVFCATDEGNCRLWVDV